MRLVLMALLFSSSVYASEIDSFTRRYEPLEDSLEKITAYTNRLIVRAVNVINRRKHACSPRSQKKLMNELYEGLGHHFGRVKSDVKGESKLWSLRRFVVAKGDIHRRKVKQKQSIYRDFNARDSLILGVAGRYLFSNLGVLVKMGSERPLIIGSDKFSHFFYHGWRHYKKHYKKHIAIRDVLLGSIKAEQRVWGAKMTGVLSWADLTANFQGMRFWNRVFADGNDPILRARPKPYLVCQVVDGKRQWVIQEPFKWTDYMDEAWDEAYNCSQFRKARLAKKVLKRIEQLAAKDPANTYRCPLRADSLNTASQNYGEFAKYLINFSGISAYSRDLLK